MKCVIWPGCTNFCIQLYVNAKDTKYKKSSVLFTCCGCDVIWFTANVFDDSLQFYNIRNSRFKACDQVGIFGVENLGLLDGFLICFTIVGEQVVLCFFYFFPLHQQGDISHPDHTQTFWTQHCKNTQLFMLKNLHYSLYLNLILFLSQILSYILSSFTIVVSWVFYFKNLD